MKQLVFVPTIGFRPLGTRVLRERAETTADGTRLMVLAAAAAPDRTDLVIEWERRGDPASCPPGSQLLMHSNMAPLENGLTAELVVGANRLPAITMRRHAMQVSSPSVSVVHVLTFGETLGGADGVELNIREGGSEWSVSLDLINGQASAMPLAVQVARDGIVVRATAVGRSENKLVVEFEVTAPTQIRTVASPIPSPFRFSSTSDDDHAERVRGHRRFFGEFFGERLRPITLEVDDGVQIEESGRLFSLEPQQSAPGQAFVNRFVVAFEAPGSNVKRAAIVIPFVELNDVSPSATADLREVPLDVALAEHRFRVVAVEPHGADERKITIELPASTATPRFVQPARLHGSDPQFAWERHAVDADLPYRNAIWMATKVGDPPIVTFKGAVMRVDGPLRLELPLA